ncbi:hypothetical protein KI387_037104, partial [Taxus chinensis]
LRGSVTKVTKARTIRRLGGKELPKYSRGAFPEIFLREMEAQWKNENERRGMLSYVLLGTATRWWAIHQESLFEWRE